MDTSSQPSLLELCPVCGHREFNFQKILWPELVQEWELRADEETYIAAAIREFASSASSR
jgi:hypothetical protein